MNEPALAAEFERALFNIEAREMTELRRHGICCETVMEVAGIGREKIITAGRTYTPDPTGTPALIIAVWHPGAPCLWRPENAGASLIDLIAFTPREPQMWWYRCGDQPCILGADLYMLAMLTGNPITLHPSPWAYLKAEATGACNLFEAENIAEVQKAA